VKARFVHNAFRLRQSLITVVISSVIATSSFSFDIRYWVWQRDEPLDEMELAELAAQHVDTIYWHIGELENVGQTWRWKARFHFPTANANGLRFVPVVRLVSREKEPFSDASSAALIAQLKAANGKQDELELDYDAPDRLVADYAAVLKRIHESVPKLTITALPHWSRNDYLQILTASVDELLPMLYDYEAEPILKDHAPLPLIAPEKVSKLTADWGKCSGRWRAGLPTFARLSVYDANEKLRGQIRNWNWDELSFNRSLVTASGGKWGSFILRAARSTSIANTPIRPNEEVIIREVDRAVLRDAIAAAARAGAQSAVLFRLPDSSASSGWSLHQLGHLEARPRLILRKSDSAEAFELSNLGDGDLEPRFAANAAEGGGYNLEIENPTPIFREAQPGDFVSVSAYAGNRPAALPFATRLQFKFAQLRAGEKLMTGLIQLAPGADFRQARYRILNSEGGPSWKSLE
jgi:hypothetical protein